MIFGELDTKKTKPLISTRTPKNSPHYQSLPVEEREVEKKKTYVNPLIRVYSCLMVPPLLRAVSLALYIDVGWLNRRCSKPLVGGRGCFTVPASRPGRRI